jgi:outer membrane protein assembly factor BamD
MSLRSSISIRSAPRAVLFAVFSLTICFFSGCALLRHPNTSGLPVAPGDQPDKILLDKAQAELQHGRYDTGRLLLQSLINTYPDSEYLSQAKLAIASSYYRQGGISGLTEAEAEYKDFITFFPTAPEAPMAEYRAGMCHYRLMGKADRDPTEAQDAEEEFREFLLKFPDSPLMPLVKDRLREVQEVLAQGDYEIAMFYYEHDAYKAADGRFTDVVNQYPSFSQGDHVFWYLGQTLAQLHKPREAVPYYDRLIMEFPLSPLVKDAQTALVTLHEPVPKPTDAMLARAQADAIRDDRRSTFQKMFGGLSSAPDISQTLHGPVILGSPNQIQATIARLDAPKPKPATQSHTLAANTVTEPGGAASAVHTDPAPNHPAPASPAPASKKQPAAPAKKANKTNKANKAKPSSSSSSKKKGKFHFLKKIVP